MGIDLYSLIELKMDREIWKNLDVIPIFCTFCEKESSIRYGTLYNIIRRNANGIYCSRKCAGSHRAEITQKKYIDGGGKKCKRCGDFKNLNDFSALPNPPYFRSECKRCHNYKPARYYGLLKEKAARLKINFNLSLDEFLKYLNVDCFYCGEKVKSIRLEICVLELGYQKDNIVSCCNDCQKFKNNLNHFDFINSCHKISVHLKKEGS